MKDIIAYGLLLLLVLATFSCKQAQDIKAFTEAKYSLQGVSDVKVNDIDVEERLQAQQGLSFGERDSLLAAVTSNSLQVSSTLALHVELQDSVEDRSLTVTKLEWLLLVDEEEALTGTINETIVLQEGLNTIPIKTPVGIAVSENQQNYAGLNRLISLVSKKSDIRQHITLKIKPTIQTPVGAIESPRFITVSKPAALASL
ncbi:hypothetical protein [Pontibacter ruber]|uniref:Late embryogenesis abundant protein n=1 Tax=Pontibacter ruber TaxID=1343895 RepID=A0ABW5CT45_9BACT|nr:hypothetical protein [Pontibacter ruber]